MLLDLVSTQRTPGAVSHASWWLQVSRRHPMTEAREVLSSMQMILCVLPCTSGSNLLNSGCRVGPHLCCCEVGRNVSSDTSILLSVVVQNGCRLPAGASWKVTWLASWSVQGAKSVFS